MAMRWYVAYTLSYRDIEEILKDRGLVIDHATINLCVIEYAPQLSANFRKAIHSCGKPRVVNNNKSGSNTAALNEINKNMPESDKIKIRQNKYLNNIIEQDHRFIKKITRSTLGFKAMHSARATLDGIELHHMLRKGQHINSKNQSVIEQFYALAA